MCKRYTQYERSSSIQKLQKLEDSEVVLSDEQNGEMCGVMEAIQDEDLDKLYHEGDQHGVGSLMKMIWLTDKDRQKKQFFLNQVQNSKCTLFVCIIVIIYTLASGGHGNRWSMITIRMGE